MLTRPAVEIGEPHARTVGNPNDGAECAADRAEVHAPEAVEDRALRMESASAAPERHRRAMM